MCYSYIQVHLVSQMWRPFRIFTWYPGSFFTSTAISAAVPSNVIFFWKFVFYSVSHIKCRISVYMHKYLTPSTNLLMKSNVKKKDFRDSKQCCEYPAPLFSCLLELLLAAVTWSNRFLHGFIRSLWNNCGLLFFTLLLHFIEVYRHLFMHRSCHSSLLSWGLDFDCSTLLLSGHCSTSPLVCSKATLQT